MSCKYIYPIHFSKVGIFWANTGTIQELYSLYGYNTNSTSIGNLSQHNATWYVSPID